MHRGVSEWSRSGKLEAGDLAYWWDGEQAVARMHHTEWSQVTRQKRKLTCTTS